jgi:hypothetical protein
LQASTIPASRRLAIIVASFFGTLWSMDMLWGQKCPQGRVPQLNPPYASPGGFAFTFMAPELTELADNLTAPKRSKYVVCEDDVLLGPGHALHQEILAAGRGRYSHWVAVFIFSTSDNSNPNKNGRKYIAVLP